MTTRAKATITSSSGQSRTKGNQIRKLRAPRLADAHVDDDRGQDHRYRLSLSAASSAVISPLSSRSRTSFALESGIGLDVDLDKLELRGDAVQPVLDGGVAHAECLLHLLDRAVAAHELADEDLVLVAEPREHRQLELALYRDVAVL